MKIKIKAKSILQVNEYKKDKKINNSCAWYVTYVNKQIAKHQIIIGVRN